MNDDTQVNIDPTIQPPLDTPLVSIAPPVVPPPVDENVAAARAVKAKIGLPAFEMPTPEVFTNITAGREDQLRKQAAGMVDFQTSARKQQIINDMAQDQKRPFTPMEAQTIKQFLDTKQTNPDTVFEEFYAKTFMENLRKAAQDNPDSFVNEILAKDPKAFEKGIEVGTDLKAKKEFFRRLEDKVDAVAEGHGGVRSVLDFLKYAIPGYNEFNLRGLSGDYQSFLGENLDREATNTYRLPFDQATKRAASIVDSLLTGKLGGNPMLAKTYLQHLNDPSSFSTTVDNLFSAMDFATISAKPLALASRVRANSALKAAAAALLKTEEFPTGLSNPGWLSRTKELADRISPQLGQSGAPVDRFLQENFPHLVPNKNHVGIANPSTTLSTSSYMDDLVKRIAAQSQDLDIVPQFSLLPSQGSATIAGRSASLVSHMDDMVKRIEVAAKEATGNIKEAGITSGAKLVETALTSDVPPTMSIKGMQSVFNAHIQKLREDPRGFSQELVNRLVENTQKTGDNLISAVSTAIKVERLPTFLAADKAVREYVANRKVALPGINNNVMDVKLRYDPIQNVHFDDYYLGKSGTELFGTERSAQAFINNNPVRGPANKTVSPKPNLKELGAKVVPAGKATAIPPVKEGYARFFHGGDRKPDGARWVSPSETYARGYSPTSGKVWYIDIKEDSNLLKKSFDDTGATVKSPYTSFEAPAEFAPQFQLHGQGIGDQYARVEQNGAGFHVVFSKPTDETHPIIRSAISMADTKTPESWVNAWGGYLGSARTPEETLAREQNLNRHVAAYGPSTLLKLAKDTADDIKNIRGWALPGTAKKAKWEQWQRIINESGAATEGRMFDTIGEVQDMYQNVLHRLPDEQEVAAYFAFKNQRLIEHQLENLQTYTAKMRVGAETHTVKVLQKTDETKKAINFKTQSVKVDGTRQTAFPTDGESVLIVGDEFGKEYVRSTVNIKGSLRERLVEEMKTGRSVMIKLTNPEEYPFRHWNTGESRPKYVIARQVESSPLEWEQSDFRKTPSYDYDHYVAQPIIRRDPISGIVHYDGDRHIAVANIRAMGRDMAEKLDKIREYIRADDIDGAKTFHATTKLPQDFNDIHSWFKTDVTSEGLPVPARLSKDEKIRLVPYNKNVNDLDKDLQRKHGDNLVDHTKDQFKRTYQDDPDPTSIFAYNNEGSKDNPLYKIAPVKYIDPVTTMNRSLNRVINDTFLNDYKMFSVEHWIAEAKDYLSVSDDRLAAAPTYFFHNPTWKASAPVQKVNNLLTAQLQIKQFLGVQDKTSTYLHAAAQQLSDAIYEKAGSKLALVPTWAIPSIRDPFTFVRSLTFDAKLGLFALPQLWVQLQTFTNIFGIAGIKNAGAGTGATLLHQWSRFSHDPAILDHLDGLASKMGFRPGEWKEAHAIGTDSGFLNVAGEHAMRDNPFGNHLTGSAPQQFLSFGRVAFTEGERATRIGAWYTAYKEFREQNPTGALTNANKREILNRADLLTMNMSRASNSALQQGIFSPASQFLTYQLRTAELMLGKRLTPTEKLRTFGFNAALYGVPAAFGLSGLPIGDYLRRDAQEAGYQLGDSYFNSLITEGGLSTFIAALSGGGDLKKGTFYNVGERYGSKGFDQFDPLRSDEPWWKLIGGASTSTLINTLGSFDDFTNAALSAFRDDGKVFKLTMDSFIKPFKELAGPNNVYQLIMALNTGKIFSKKESYLTDVDKSGAIFQFISGLHPQEQSDMYAKNLTRQHEKDLQTKAIQSFTTEYQRFIRAGELDPEEARTHFANAFAILRIAGYPEEDFPKAIAIASQGYESQINRTNWQFLNQDVPTYRKPAAAKAQEINSQLLNQRNQEQVSP